jgi:NADH-quinone oxidoreductase subunit E
MTLPPELEAKFTEILAKYPPEHKKSALVPLLLYSQDVLGRITQDLIYEIANRVGVFPVQVEEVITYYSMLHFPKPMGKYHVQICTNISCQLTGGMELYERACKKLGLGHKEVSEDGLISLEEVECIGACSWAPAVQVNYDFYHSVTPEKLDQLLDSLRQPQ